MAPVFIPSYKVVFTSRREQFRGQEPTRLVLLDGKFSQKDDQVCQTLSRQRLHDFFHPQELDSLERFLHNNIMFHADAESTDILNNILTFPTRVAQCCCQGSGCRPDLCQKDDRCGLCLGKTCQYDIGNDRLQAVVPCKYNIFYSQR